MTGRRSAGWQGILAAVITFLVIVIPTAVIVYGAQAGSVGSVSVPGFGGIASLVLALIAAAVGYMVYRAYRFDPERRPGDVWSRWFTGLVALVVGSWFVPFVVLFVFIDSDHALADRMAAVMLVWIVGHVAVAVVAWRMMRDRSAQVPLSEGHTQSSSK